MTRELTPVIKDWLDRFDPANQDAILEGADILLRVNRNRIFHTNVCRAPLRFAQHLYYELNKIYQARQKTALAEVTRKEVAQMMRSVDDIDRRMGLSDQQDKLVYQKGKRQDHDSLPDEIKQLYIDNDQIRLKIREAHLRLRLVSEDNSSCPDSDRFPWAKEIIRLDKLYRQNWYRYDHYGRSDPQEAARRSKHAVRMINLNKHRLKVSDDSALLAQMRLWWADVINPSEKLTLEMSALGINDQDSQNH